MSLASCDDETRAAEVYSDVGSLVRIKCDDVADVEEVDAET